MASNDKNDHPLTAAEILQRASAPVPKALDAIRKQEEIFRSVTPASLGFTQPSLPPLNIPVNPNLVSEFYKRLTEWVAKFDKELDQEHEVGVRLVSFGQTVTFHLDDMGYWNPSLISFSGVSPEGDPVELIQHVSQISILLMKMKRKDPEKPKRPIGFIQPQASESGGDV